MSAIFGKKQKNRKAAAQKPVEPQLNHEDHPDHGVNGDKNGSNGGHQEVNDRYRHEHPPTNPVEENGQVEKASNGSSPQQRAPRPKLVFHCQQAQGSPTGIISGFTNVKELYQKIAECYDFPSTEILFCTLNTHKIDMNKLLGGQIGLDDFIFAHRRGRPKEVEVYKSDEALGLTITDNGAGYAFIKRIKDNSVIANLGCIEVGDHLERIDDRSLIGCRHFEVAKILKEIPKGTTFLLRVVEPLRAGFANIDKRSGGGSKKQSYGSGRQTLRFKANGSAKVEEVDDARTLAEEKINELLEGFLGINDAELSSQIWELAKTSSNTMEFAEAIDHSDLEAFGFTDDFIFELWGVITDAKSGRLAAKKLEELHF